MSLRHCHIARPRPTHARRIRAERLEARLVLSTITWDGAAADEGDPQAGDGHAFFDPWNWDGNQVPGASDVAIVPAGAGPIDYLGDATLAALECQTDFRLHGGTLELAGASWVDGDLLMAGGTLTAPRTLAVYGAFHWTGGKLTGGGRIELQSGGTIDAAAAKSLDDFTLENRGLLVWSGSGPIRAANGAILRNEVGAELQIQSDAALDYEFGLPPAIDNAGLVRKSAGAGGSVLGAAFNNTGTLQVEVGDVTLAGGGANKGTFQIAELASVHVGLGNLQLNAGSQIVGGGELIVGGDGTLDVPSGVDVPVDALALTPGSGGITGLGTLTVVHTMRWTGGRMDSAGVTSIAPGATLEIGGPNAKYLDRRTLENRGQATWSGGGLLDASNGALIDNRDNPVAPPGRWEITGDSLLIHTAGAQPVLRNSGQLVATADADLVSFAYLDNRATGAVHISGGGIALHGGGSSTGPIEIAAGGSLRVEGEALTLSAGTSQIGPGPIVVGGAGTLDVPAGANVSIETLTLNPGSGGLDGGGTITIAGAMNWTGGRMAGPGATAIAPGATLVVSGTATKTLDGRTLTNRGYVLWSGDGAIDVANGAAIVNLANPIAPHGTWEIATAASLNYAAGAPPSFQNSGVVHATNLGLSATLGINVVNTGQVLVDAGAALAFNANFTQTSGATVTNGTLVAAEGLDIDGGSVGGFGTIAGSLANAGQLSIGASPGRLTVSGPLVQGPTASLAIDLAGEVAGIEYDQLVVGGPVSLDGTLSVSCSFTPAAGTTFVILDNLGGDPITGAFDGLPEGQSFVVAGQPLVISYKGGTGNDVVLVAQAPPGNSVVSNTLDSGPGSLRQAIADANAAAGANTITFAIPGAGPHAIGLASALPSLVEAVTLDVPAGTSVEVGGASAFGFPDFATLTKIGAGTIVFAGGDVRIGGDALSIDAGLLRFRNGATGLLAVHSLAVSPGATLDLNDSDLVVHATPATRAAVLAQITGLVASGAANLTWNGPGIASSAASSDANLLTALGEMLNDNGLGGGFYASFSGEPVGPNDVLVKYTYYGDADLSGSVDGTDYALVDNGFNAALAGWFNGDFDYTATIDGTDYALIDNAFNSQSAPLAAFGPIPRAASAADARDGCPTNSLPLMGRAGEGGSAANEPSSIARAAHDRVLADWNAVDIDLDWLAVLSGGSRRRRAAR